MFSLTSPFYFWETFYNLAQFLYNSRYSLHNLFPKSHKMLIFFPPTLSEALHTWTILGFIPPNLAEKYIKFFCLSVKFPQVQGLKLLALSKKNEAKIFEKKIPPIVTFSTCVMRFLLFYVAKQTPWTFSVETWLTAYQQRSQACWKHILDQ